MLAQLEKKDAQLSQQLRVAEKPGKRRNLSILFGHSGDSWSLLVMLAAAALLIPSWRENAFIMIAGIVLTAVVVLAIKFSVRRRRPEGEWGQLYRRADPHSFPSGHAARAAMLAVLGLALGSPWLGWLLLVWAPLVGLARVATGLHYVSDILAGWVLGIAMGFVTLRLWELFAHQWLAGLL